MAFSVPLLDPVGCEMFIKPDANSRIRIPIEVAEGFEFQHAQERRVFRAGLRGAFALLKAVNYGFVSRGGKFLILSVRICACP